MQQSIVSRPQAQLPWLVLGATAVALALRLYHLSFQSLWWDEGISLYLASLDWGALLWQKNFALDLHPPLYHLLLGLWTALTGPSPFAARAFSALVGTLNVPLLYAVGARLAGRPVGLAAAWLLAIAPFPIFYSQELRMYALMPLLATASTYAFLQILRPSAAGVSGRAVLAYAVTTAAGLWTYYYVALLVVAQNVFFAFWWLGRRTGFRPWLAGQLSAAALFVPWVLLAGTALAGGSFLAVAGSPYGWSEAGHFGRVFAIAFSVGFAEIVPWSTWAALVTFTLAGLGLLLTRWRLEYGGGFVVLWLLLPPVLAFAIATQRAFLFPRFVLFSAFALYVLAGAGLVWLWRRARLLGASGLVLLTAAAALGLSYHYTVPRTAYASGDYLPLLAQLRSSAEPGDLVLANQAWGAGYARAYLPSAGPAVAWSQPSWNADATRARAAAEDLLDQHRRVWLLSWCEGGRCETDKVAEALGTVGQRYYTQQTGEFALRLYAKEVLPALAVGDRLGTFGEAITMARAEATPTGTLRPGQKVTLTLVWRAERRPNADYTVFTQLLGPDGRVHGQKDGPPLGGAQPTSGWSAGEVTVDSYTLTVADGAPAGEYRLIVGWYEPQSGKRLMVGGSDFLEVGHWGLKRD